MTDLEISEKLALAIGWNRKVVTSHNTNAVWVYTGSCWMLFDYRTWSIIGPIAQRYSAFPSDCHGDGSWWIAGCGRIGKDVGQGASTPQKAIAMAVIEGTK